MPIYTIHIIRIHDNIEESFNALHPCHSVLRGNGARNGVGHCARRRDKRTAYWSRDCYSRREKTVSDLNGEFKINVKRGERVSISYVGYENKQLRIDDTQQRTVVNLDKGLTLKEVNVVASIASARSKKAVGADVAHLDATKLLDKGQASNLSDLLDGRVSGMQMFQSNGKVGMPIRFNMRSGATFSMDRDPIIYIDGVRYNNSHTSDINTSQDALSALNDLPMNDIASIDINKQALAVASGS